MPRSVAVDGAGQVDGMGLLISATRTGETSLWTRVLVPSGATSYILPKRTTSSAGFTPPAGLASVSVKSAIGTPTTSRFEVSAPVEKAAYWPVGSEGGGGPL